MNHSEMTRVNKTVIICHGVLAGLIAGAYALEVIKGSRTVLYVACIAVLALTPVAVEILMFKKKPESTQIKRVVGYSYAALCGVAMFTTNSLLPFTYAIPMLIVVTLYWDVRYCVIVGIGVNLLNIASVIYIAVTDGIAKEVMPDIEIRILVTILIAVYLDVTTYLLKQINLAKQKEMAEQNRKVETLLQDVMKLSGELTDGIEKVNRDMETLEISSDKMGTAMEEVSAGTAETAESVQNQLLRTEEIQKLIEDVDAIGKHITEGMGTASGEVKRGLSNMKELEQQSEKSKQANETVVTLMHELQEQAQKMDDIITVITNVANSTGMLALNASIEAARAGEAGRGFAVVASQVSELSEQTKSAAVNITGLIRSVVHELGQVADAVAILDENTKEQEEKSVELDKSLQIIAQMINDINGQTKRMEEMITSLSTANGDIVRDVQTISAITQEVTAHSSETMSSCRDNIKLIGNVSQVTVQLQESAQELKNAR